MNDLKSITALLLLVVGQSLHSEIWSRGAAAVLEADGEVRIAVRGTDITFDSIESPVYFPGVFSSDIRGAGSAFFYTSNGVMIRFVGEGVFSVDRFESLAAPEVGTGQNVGESLGHMILNLRRGKLLIDNRALSDNSKFLVETPVGRVTFLKGVFLLEIMHDSRSSLYNFSIACAQGTARFTAFDTEPYLIYAGQQITGTGSHSSPSVGLGAQSGRVREQLIDFTEALSVLDKNRIDGKELYAHVTQLQSKENSSAQAATMLLPESDINNTTPIIIEYSPNAEPISPLRAVVQPTAQPESELFTPID